MIAHKGGNVVAVGERRNKLFEMKFRSRISNPESQANAAASVDSLQTLHNRLAHQHAGQVKKILRKSQTPFDDQDFRCKSCIFGKMHRLPFLKSISKSSRVGDGFMWTHAGKIFRRSSLLFAVEGLFFILENFVLHQAKIRYV
jgi:hypothetical protein